MEIKKLSKDEKWEKYISDNRKLTIKMKDKRYVMWYTPKNEREVFKYFDTYKEMCDYVMENKIVNWSCKLIPK